jgi:hypothetical protein
MAISLRGLTVIDSNEMPPQELLANDSGAMELGRSN